MTATLARSIQMPRVNRLGPYVKSLREHAEMTQGELAQKVGVSRQTIAAIEGGDIKVPSQDIIGGLAVALNVTDIRLAWAMGYVKDPEREDPTTLAALNEVRQKAEEIYRILGAEPPSTGGE